MHSQKTIVINTGPIITLVAGLGDLSILKSLYKDVLVPFEVCSEVLQGGSSSFAVNEFQDAAWLLKESAPQIISPFLNPVSLKRALTPLNTLNKKHEVSYEN